MTIQENISLKPYNTFGIDVLARFFVQVNSVEELVTILKKYNTETPKFFLGGGSNVLLTKDFDGLVIQLNLNGISEEIINDREVLIKTSAGENWHQFVLYCLGKNYGGLENLSLIPGNVGTSPMQNIGAYGTEIKDVFENCKVLNLQTLEIEILNLDDCKFGYRDSIFKRESKGKYVIVEVTFRLTKNNHKILIGYGAIRSELDSLGIINPTIQDVSNAVIKIRKSKLPDPSQIGNAGSFFKNPSIPKKQFESLKLRFENIQGYPNGDVVKIPAGWLIEQSGWKGKQVGNVASYILQSLVITNITGKASGQEIYDFSTMIINSVKNKYGIELEREVNCI